MGDIVVIVLATWAVVWALTFWHKTEWLRERLGVYFVYDDQGFPIDRDDIGGLGGWLNCPACCAVLAVGPVLILWAFAEPIAWTLACLGASLFVVRWYETLRPKREWWT